ncbi:nucleoid-associated protein [Sphingobium sp. CR2-8]|uniref:nucleoid-associated protein n=1 Tax=Sphingobium sp. CR2-8 TaxID=1306534 RepID=UPI002DB92972|nr:nucleoid-associated protein [Sphingobium sp. CR2-8]MEC3910070.1 nucleoid-associated protein [Sphingobium sp. CR2-8]
MEMDIREFGPGSALDIGAELVKQRDPQFINQSRQFAEALATAQISRQIPGGLMVVFDGTLGNPATPFFGLMKAELHEGFVKTANLQARFVNDLFLSPKTKLYKIGIFISDGANPRPALPEGWRTVVYDSAMSASHRDAAATYFYSNFLGLNIPENAAHQVKKFFEETKAFIKAQNIPEKDKVDLYNGLYAYLKIDKGNTIQTSRFAKTYMAADLGDDYLAHMKRKRFPAAAIAKDISELSGVLRWRKFKFPRAITLSGPPDAIKDLVTVDSVNGDGGQTWTQITVRAQLQSQE